MRPWARAAVAAVLAALLAPTQTSPAQEPQSPGALREVSSPGAEVGSAEDIAAYVDTRRQELHLPGVSFVVVRDGAVVVAGGSGEAGPGGPPVSPDTPFLLGSTSKQFTGLLVQRLVRTGRLSLDAEVHQLLPAFGADGSALSRVTVRDLLGQTSGLSTRAGLDQWGWRLSRPSSIEDAAGALEDGDLTAAPGERFQYSNSNYDALGAVVEAVTHTTYAEALDELVTGPLGLDSTTADLAHPPARLASGYYRWLGRLPVVTPAPSLPGAVPSSMVVSTASDLGRLVQAHLGGPGAGELASTLEAARTPLTRVNEYAEYASGWWVRPFWERNPGNARPTDPALPVCVEHDGTTDRSMSYLLACPAAGFGVVALADAGPGPDDSEWWAFRDGLVHTALGTAPAAVQPDLVIRNAALVLVAVPVLLAVLVSLQVRALRRRRHPVGWALAAALAGIGALWLGYVYVPGRSPDTPLHTLWSAVPDVAVSTLLGTLLALISLALLPVALRRHRRSSETEEHPAAAR